MTLCIFCGNITFFKPSSCLFQDFPCIAVVGLGKNNAGVCGAENWDISKESVRQAVSGRTLDSVEIITDFMDGMCRVVVPSKKKKNVCVCVQLDVAYFRTWK